MNIDKLKEIQGEVVPVVKYDPFYGANNDILRAVSDPIELIDDAIRCIGDSLKKTLYFYNAAGISAPQIGVNKRIIAINHSLNFDNLSESDILIMVNPEIVSDYSDEDLINGMEGCLSFPDSFVAVLRPTTVAVRYLDIEGNTVESTFYGYHARTILHEIEHLDGTLIIDNVSGLKKNLIIDKQKKMFNSKDIDNDKVALNMIRSI